MLRRMWICVAIAVGLSFPPFALCQADPITALLKQEKLSNVPIDCQTDIQPGSYIATMQDGSSTCSMPGDLGHGYDLLFPAALPIATVGGVTLDLEGSGSLLAKILGYQIGGALTSTNTLTSDQAVFSVAKLQNDSIDTIVDQDPATDAFVEKWKEKGATIYIVQSVYRTKALNITAGNAKGVEVVNGKATTSCTVTDPTPKDKANKAANDSAAPAAAAAAKNVGKTNNKTVGAVAGDVGIAAITALSKDLTAAAANAATSAATAAASPVTMSGDICKTNQGTYVLQSQTDVVVGLKVDLLNYARDRIRIGHRNQNAWTLTWFPINPQPVFQ